MPEHNLYDLAEDLCHMRGHDPAERVSDPTGRRGSVTRESLAYDELVDFQRKLQLFGLLPEET